MAFFFSAVYSESLYLALSVGLFWRARQGRWALVGVLGALAAATRSTGLVLLLPALMLYLYGPREDRLRPDFARAPRGAALRRATACARTCCGCALVPAGPRRCTWLYLALAGGDALAPFHAQDIWGRHFAGPYVGVWDGVRAAFEGARQLLSFQQRARVLPGRRRTARSSPPSTTCCCSRSCSAAVAGDRAACCARLPLRLRRSTCSRRSRCRCPTRSASPAADVAAALSASCCSR